jgi:hypothetical protein
LPDDSVISNQQELPVAALGTFRHVAKNVWPASSASTKALSDVIATYLTSD